MAISIANRRPSQKTDLTGLSMPWSKFGQSTAKEQIGRTNIGQTQDKLKTQPRTNIGQTQDKLKTTSANLGQTQGKLKTQPRTNLGQTQDKLKTNFDFEGISGLQRKILLFIFDTSKNVRNETTGPIAIDYLCSVCGIIKLSAQKTIQRLEKTGLLIRSEFKNGRAGWTKYKLPKNIYDQLLTLETQDKLRTNLGQTQDKLKSQPRTQPRTNAPSSSSLNKETTTIEEPTLTDIRATKQFNFLSERLVLDELNLDLGWWNQTWEKCKKADYSLEKTCFLLEGNVDYLRRKEGEGIKDPRGWIYKKILSGTCEFHKDFESWEIKNEKIFQVEMQRQLKKIKEEKEKTKELEFDLFWEGLSEEKKEEMRKGHQKIFTPGEIGDKTYFRALYEEGKIGSDFRDRRENIEE